MWVLAGLCCFSASTAPCAHSVCSLGRAVGAGGAAETPAWGRDRDTHPQAEDALGEWESPRQANLNWHNTASSEFLTKLQGRFMLKKGFFS